MGHASTRWLLAAASVCFYSRFHAGLVIRKHDMYPFIHLFLAMEIAGPHSRCTAQLSPIGEAINPYGSFQLEQMAFDPTGSNLYVANVYGGTIIRVSQIDSAPLTPSNGAPWSYSIVAGADGTAGLPSIAEVPPSVARFMSPTGVAGWPLYAIGPFSTNSGPIAESWAGLWIGDLNNHAVRFINFYRSSNVTLVAGSSAGAAGALDGIGAAALLNRPRNIALGRFLSNTVGDLPVASTTTKAWTSVVYWGDQGNNCVRYRVSRCTIGPSHRSMNLQLQRA